MSMYLYKSAHPIGHILHNTNERLLFKTSSLFIILRTLLPYCFYCTITLAQLQAKLTSIEIVLTVATPARSLTCNQNRNRNYVKLLNPTYSCYSVIRN